MGTEPRCRETHTLKLAVFDDTPHMWNREVRIYEPCDECGYAWTPNAIEVMASAPEQHPFDGA